MYVFNDCISLAQELCSSVNIPNRYKNFFPQYVFESKITRQKSSSDLLKGETENVVISSRGTIQLGRSAEVMVEQFEDYMNEKKANVLKKKFLDKKHTKYHPQYLYLKNRFSAVEKAIVRFFDKRELEGIRKLYEEEMMRRILKATEH